MGRWEGWHNQKVGIISDFNEAKHDSVTVASAGPYVETFTLNPSQIITATPHHSIFTAWVDAPTDIQLTASKY